MAGIGDFMGLMGKVKDVQANMQRIQEEQRSRTFEAASDGWQPPSLRGRWLDERWHLK